MKNGKSPTLNMIGTAAGTFIGVLPALLIFEVGYKLLCLLIFRPLLSAIMQGVLKISGYDLAFNEEIAGFYTNISGIIGTIILCILASLLVYYEFAVIILMVYYRYMGAPLSLADAMKMALTTFRSLASIGIIGFALYALGLLPLLRLGLVPSLRPEGEVPNFITGELYKSVFGSILMTLFYIVMYLIFFCAVFVLPIMVLRRRKFGKSFVGSLRVILSLKPQYIVPVVLIFAAWCVLFLYPGVLPSYFAGISDAGLFEILGNFFFSWKSILQFLLVGGLRICLMVLLFTFLVAVYVLCSGKVSLNEDALPIIDHRLKRTQNAASKVYSGFKRAGSGTAAWVSARPFFQKHKKPICIITCILVFLGVFGLLYHQPNSYDPVVVGHRGSLEGVENTLESVKGAADSGADYAEIDILLSSDNVPMVIHDDNLKRLSGENVNVYEMTASQLSKLTLSQDGHTGKISTLDEIINYARGKVDLLIELKLHGHEKANIVKQVTKVIEQNHFQKNCSIMSLEYDLVKDLKKHYPQYKTGYCVYGNLGRAKLNSLRELNVDFLIIEESMATNSFIAQCRKAWLPVYVWTVNKQQAMKSCLKMGAAGIITDHPKEARKIADQYIQDSM